MFILMRLQPILNLYFNACWKFKSNTRQSSFSIECLFVSQCIWSTITFVHHQFFYVHDICLKCSISQLRPFKHQIYVYLPFILSRTVVFWQRVVRDVSLQAGKFFDMTTTSGPRSAAAGPGKISMDDLLGGPRSKHYETGSGAAKVAGFRKQEEYGPKKFIKPWRTGTKSQQQIAPKGHNKGFRGKTAPMASKK